MRMANEVDRELAAAWLGFAVSALGCRSIAPPADLHAALALGRSRLHEEGLELDPVQLCFDLLKVATRYGAAFDPVPYVRVYTRWRLEGETHAGALARLRRVGDLLTAHRAPTADPARTAPSLDGRPAEGALEPRAPLPSPVTAAAPAAPERDDASAPQAARGSRLLNLNDYPGFAQGRRRTPPGAVYIGAPSKWANPFRLRRTKASPEARRAAQREHLCRYEEHVRSSPDLLASLHELRGKDLACWCAPEPCHGDVLLALLAETAEPIGGSHRPSAGA